MTCTATKGKKWGKKTAESPRVWLDQTGGGRKTAKWLRGGGDWKGNVETGREKMGAYRRINALKTHEEPVETGKGVRTPSRKVDKTPLSRKDLELRRRGGAWDGLKKSKGGDDACSLTEKKK